MKAARLNEAGASLQLEDLPDPEVRDGGVVVRVLASALMSYTGEVLAALTGRLTPAKIKFSDGSEMPVDAGRLAPILPFTPGLSAVGVVEAFGENVFGLELGQKVLCSPYYTNGPNGQAPESILIGWLGVSESAAGPMQLWKNGSFAEKALYPAECVTPLGAVEGLDPARLAALNVLTIAYGALLNGEFRAGQRVIVAGATGNIGSAAVLLALALGASSVVAAGRDEAVLETLTALDPARVHAVSLRGEPAEYAQELARVSGGADLSIDALGAAPNADATLACIAALRIGGTAIIVGGVRGDIALPYPMFLRKELTLRGSYMFPRDAPSELLRMIASGVLSLDAFGVHAFPLADINEAIAQAPSFRGLEYAVVVP